MIDRPFDVAPFDGAVTGHHVWYCRWSGPHVTVWPNCIGCHRHLGLFDGVSRSRVDMDRDRAGNLLTVIHCHCGADNVLRDQFVRWPWNWTAFPRGAATERDAVFDGEVTGTYIVQEVARGRWLERYEPCSCGADLNPGGMRGQLGMNADNPDRVLRQLSCECGTGVLLELYGIRDSAGEWVSGGPS